MNKSSCTVEWFYRNREKDWILFIPQSEIKLQCKYEHGSNYPEYSFQLSHPKPQFYNPTLVCYDPGHCSVFINWRQNPIEPITEIYGLDRKGEVLVLDDRCGLRCADILASFAGYVRTAENLPHNLKDPLVAGLELLESSLNSR